MINSRSLEVLAQEVGIPLRTEGAPGVPFPDWVQLAEIINQLVSNVCPERPVIAISGSQGSGKSTLAQVVTSQHSSLSSVSLDDFYLPRVERAQLASTVHPLLAVRGVPGTHDHAWLADAIAAIKTGSSTAVPRFDKGTDDRIEGRMLNGTGLILDGWCLGVRSERSTELTAPCNSLERWHDADGRWRRWVNEQLQTHYEPLWDEVDFWVHLRVPGFAQILQWRHQQEQTIEPELRMTKAEVEHFIQHYERLTRQLWRQPPCGPGVLVELDEHHKTISIVSVGPAPGHQHPR